MADRNMYPSSLRKLNHWVLWGHPFEKEKKMPCYPSNGQRAKVNDPTTWDAFETAYSQRRAMNCLGIGFVLVSGIVCIDLDHCFKGGELTPESQAIVTLFKGTYIEKSQSGEGIHIFVKGHIPRNFKKEIEMYESDRYIAMTGNRLEEYSGDDLREYQEGIDCIYNQYADLEKEEVSKPTPFEDLRKRAEPHPDEWILERLMRSDKMKALFQDGDTSLYDNDQSRADLALVEKIAYWSEADPETIDRLFRQSALFRPKWDEKRGANTYGQMTIQKACGGIKYTYSQDRERQALKDFEEDYGEVEDVFFLDGKVSEKLIFEALKKVKPFDNVLKGGVDEILFSRLFARVFSGVIRWCVEQKSWYVYDGSVWVKDIDGIRAKEYMQKFQKSFDWYISTPDCQLSNHESVKKFTLKLTSKNLRDKVLDDAKARLSISNRDFDSDPDLLNCINCVLDLKTGEVHESSPFLFFTRQAQVNYDPTASSGDFSKFLDEIMEGNKDKIVYLQKVFGYTLTGRTIHEEFYIFWGATTRNGKSTFLGTIETLLGTYAFVSNPDTFKLKDRASGGTSEDIASLEGKRFVYSAEPSEGMTLDAAKLKTYTGGDTLTTRRVFEHESNFTPQCKIFFNTNHLPRVTDQTLFSSDRVRLVKFERHFEPDEQDIHLKEKLKSSENLSSILNWMLEGLRKYYADGEDLTPPEVIIRDTNDYRLQNDKTARFIEECLVKKEGGVVTGKEVYERYQQWCATSGTMPKGKSAFFYELREVWRILRSDIKKDGQHLKNVVTGYELTSSPMNMDMWGEA